MSPRYLKIAGVKAAIAKKSLTRVQVAAAVKVSVSTLRTWLRGTRVPRPGKAYLLGQALDLKYTELFSSRRPPSPVGKIGSRHAPPYKADFDHPSIARNEP
jgi:transcriptional regulator with XRE-family HTH domain